MKNISVACGAMMLCASAIAGIDLSIEKDVVELGVTASVSDSTYLSAIPDESLSLTAATATEEV